MNVFDRNAKRMQRNRTASMEDYEVYNYVKEEVGYGLADRICDIKRKFNVALDLGCSRGHVSKHIYSDMVSTLYQCEFAEKVLAQSEVSPEVPTYKMVADEEFIPFKEKSLDLVFSNLSLHWVNDLPGCFRQVQQCLKPDGAFIGSMFGGETLYELRVSLQLAEQEREGGFAAHISPFTEAQDVGNLLNRSGFTLLTIDVDEMVINYPSIYELMYDLKGMGENNCSWSRKPMLHRDTISAAGAIYKEMYGNDHGVPATYQILYFIGWKPDPSQPKALPRGSGEVSFKDLGNLDEITRKLQANKDQPQQVQLDEISKQIKALQDQIKDPNKKD
ncbi:hypothetical protein LOTGIDRAFT_121553 [Lottia gigantea]|uniref:Arginine-hydroxylase NDUFAF5, mitochondrial n=1 Tax=Lottia gigantea TaxID=225164 RepID=V4AF43_LOTGI|nr:hypothetical protein LOTGIDRAFT_121553 [Lottia gigantea]ESO91946.1 hypothetical protein LOTGIDRAFT_121553 [Lottia gigantea]